MRDIQWFDLSYRKAPVEAVSARGVPYTKWVPVGMPRIPPHIINSVFYLYQTREDAEAGRDPGGTGFIVHYERGLEGVYSGGNDYYYGVTNWHVACDGGFSTIRLNTLDGKTDIIEFDPNQWVFIPGKYDIAAIPLALDRNIHQFSSVSTSAFVDIYQPRIGVGEDVFMIGLFVDHDGVSKIVPSARFGHISMLPNPDATIEQPTEYKGISYVLDMHSRTGFSGSPVYVYRTFGNDLSETSGPVFDTLEIDSLEMEVDDNRTGRMSFGSSPITGRLRSSQGRLRSDNLLKLLGIHWGSFAEMWELHSGSSRLKEANKALITDGAYVEGMSGMTCVIPAWNIMELLETKELRDHRAHEHAKSSPSPTRRLGVRAESSSKGSGENPTHKEDFTSLLNAAAKTPPQDD